MNIELRNIKYAAFASQETPCFQAAIYVDGAKAGTVSNEGHGGCNSIHPRALEQQIDAYAKTLPVMPIAGLTENDGTPVLIQPDSDIIISRLLDEALVARDLTRLLKNKVVFARGGKILATKKGAGLGLRMVMDRCSSLYVFQVSQKSAIVCAQIDLHKKRRTAQGVAKNLLICFDKLDG